MIFIDNLSISISEIIFLVDKNCAKFELYLIFINKYENLRADITNLVIKVLII